MRSAATLEGQCRVVEEEGVGQGGGGEGGGGDKKGPTSTGADSYKAAIFQRRAHE